MSISHIAARSIVLGTTLSMAFMPISRSVSAAPDSFACDPGFYQVIAGQFAEFDPGAGTYTTIGADTDNYTAMGYRIADGYMYAVGNGNLYRVNADGVRTVVGSLGGMTSGYTGTFGDDGLLHVSRGGADWYTIDVDTLETTPIPELSQGMGVADITNVNGIFYGVSSRGGLVRFDPTELTVTEVGAVSGLPSHSGAYGAAWSTAGGNLYVGRNSGEIFQITGYSTASPVATQVGVAPSTNSNDGASCDLAAPPAGLADVDGPVPETPPSTPEAQAAADAYEAGYEPTPIVLPESQPISSAEPSGPTYVVTDAGIGSGDECGATVLEDRPPRGPDDPFIAVIAPTVLYSSSFGAADAANWSLLSGTWEERDAELAQVENCDFDATALLSGHNVDHFRWEATFSGDSSNQGGLLINQQSAQTRSGATLIDLSEDGSTVRWGSYDDRGYYQYVGAEEITAPGAGAPMTLAVEVHGADVVIEVDGNQIGEFNTQYAGGRVGLVATQSVISFTNATLTALPSAGGAS